MKTCPNCGSLMHDNAPYCSKCGAQAPTTEGRPPKPSTLKLIAVILMIVGMLINVYNGVSSLLSDGTEARNEFLEAVDTSEMTTEEMDVVNKIADIYVTIIGICYFIPLLWCIPMTIKIWHARRDLLPLRTGFKICTLLFGQFIAGILLLCDHDQVY